jgi:hypothetical protein
VMSSPEPRNPFYFLLLFAGLVFTITALSWWAIPVLEQRAADTGEPLPPSAFRDALRADGGRWLLYELGALFVFGIASMGLDRLRALQKQRAGDTIEPSHFPRPPDRGRIETTETIETRSDEPSP